MICRFLTKNKKKETTNYSKDLKKIYSRGEDDLSKVTYGFLVVVSNHLGGRGMDLRMDLHYSSVVFVVDDDDTDLDFDTVLSYSFADTVVVAAAASFAAVGVAAVAVPIRPTAHLLKVLC